LIGIRAFASRVGIVLPEDSDLLSIAKVGFLKLTDLQAQINEHCDSCTSQLRKMEQQLIKKYRYIVEVIKDQRYRGGSLKAADS